MSERVLGKAREEGVRQHGFNDGEPIAQPFLLGMQIAPFIPRRGISDGRKRGRPRKNPAE